MRRLDTDLVRKYWVILLHFRVPEQPLPLNHKKAKGRKVARFKFRRLASMLWQLCEIIYAWDFPSSSSSRKNTNSVDDKIAFHVAQLLSPSFGIVSKKSKKKQMHKFSIKKGKSLLCGRLFVISLSHLWCWWSNNRQATDRVQ